MKHIKKSFLYNFIAIFALTTLPLPASSINDRYQELYIKNKPAAIASAGVIAAVAYGMHYYYTQQPSKLFQIPEAILSHIKAIAFDIDGVLSQTNKLKAFQEIGIPTTLYFMAQQRVIPSEKHLFDSLDFVPANSTYTSYNKGLKMPQIMIDWQTGIQEIEAIQDAIVHAFQSAQIPQTQKDWALQSALLMTTPDKFIKTRQTIPANIRLLHALKNKGYKLYILSNWDPRSFPLFQAEFPEIFMHEGKPTFDGIMISGTEKIVKPETLIFEKLINKYSLNAHQTLFIDDELANIQAAEKLGIQSIQSNPNDPILLLDQVVTLLTSSTSPISA